MSWQPPSSFRVVGYAVLSLHAILEDNTVFAGRHLLLEFWGAKNISDLHIIEKALTDAVKACGATLLQIKLHHFTPYGGISGVAIVMESHLTIHSWPEFNYAAIDIFLCGDRDPYKAIPVLKEIFQPAKVDILEFKRGMVEK